MNEQQTNHQNDKAQASQDDSPPLRTMPPFTPAQLHRQMAADGLLRWALALLIGVGLLAAFWYDLSVSITGLVFLLLVIGSWVILNTASARISRELPHLAAMIDAEPEQAEDRIVQLVRIKPLLGWVRLMLYDRLAGLRHRQQHYAESLAICATVLRYRLGPARDARPHLLLMLTEAALERRDLRSAYHALLELYHLRLSLNEALQRLALQTRYEVMCGHDSAALERTPQKVQLSELMPAAQCGALHAILATAAKRSDDRDLAHWLWQRAELLCSHEQLDELKAGGFGTGVVAPAQVATTGSG